MNTKKTWISKKLFDAIDAVMGNRDNINPAFLLHELSEFNSTPQESDSVSQSQAEGDPQTKVNRVGKAKSKNKKRKRSPTPERKLMDLMVEKWQKEEDDRKEERELQRQREAAREKNDTEALACFKAAVEIFAHMVKDD